MYGLVSYLGAAPSGSVILLSVADEAGLNQDASCNPYPTSTCLAAGLSAIEALGSTQIRNTCFNGSWAMIAVKGQGVLAEGVSTNQLVSLQAPLPDPGGYLLSVSKDGAGTGAVVSDPLGLACNEGCSAVSASFSTGTSVVLTATASPGSAFGGWSGTCTGTGICVLVADAGKSATATFTPLPPVSMSIADAAASEGYVSTGAMKFLVSLSAPATGSVSVDYVTSDGTATAGSDYVFASGQLTFAAGERRKFIEVTINGDKVEEPNETFTLTLSNPVGVTLARAVATGTILNDDEATLRVTDAKSWDWTGAKFGEGTGAGTSYLRFNIWTSKILYDRDIYVNYTTVNGTATRGLGLHRGVGNGDDRAGHGGGAGGRAGGSGFECGVGRDHDLPAIESRSTPRSSRRMAWERSWRTTAWWCRLETSR